MSKEEKSSKRMPLITKYRPNSVDDICGNANTVAKIKGMLKTKQVPNAILLAGDYGSGKTSLGYILAKEINEKADIDSIFDDGDVEEMNAAEARGIDDIRGLIKRMQFKPRSGGLRIFLIDESHALTAQAAQALLKPVEAPPEHVLWIFCTTDPQKMPKALLSRCTFLKVETPTRTELVEYFKPICKKEGIKIDDAILSVVVDTADRSPRSCLSILDGLRHLISGSDYGKEDLIKAIKKEAMSGATAEIDALAAKIALSCLTGNCKSIIGCVADIKDWIPLTNKAIYFLTYAMDSTFESSGNNVWHTVNNKKFMAALKDKGLSDLPNKLVATMEAFLYIREKLVTGVPERALIMALLVKVALKNKR